jgi:tetratricopeptide (TPR) repeat protein
MWIFKKTQIDADRLYTAAMNHAQDEKYANALDAINGALAIRPTAAWSRLAGTFAILGKYQSAVAGLGGLALDEQAAKVPFERAQVLYNENRYAEALIACDEAIRQNPDNALLWTTMGAACVKLGRAWDGAGAANLAQALGKGWKGFGRRLPQR